MAIESNDDVPEADVETSLALIELLLARGAKVPPKLRLADYACATLAIFERMWKLGASPDLPDDNGRRAIHAAVWTQRPKLVEALLAAGVALDVADAEGKTPLAIAREQRAVTPAQTEVKQQIIAMLEAKGAPEDTGGAGMPLAELRARAAKAKLAKSVHGVLDAKLASAEDLVAQLKRKTLPADALGLVPVLAQVLPADGPKTHAKDVTIKLATFHNGDLHAKRHLTVHAPLVVTGNLVVDGVMSDAGPDSWILVGKDLTARALYSDGELHVAGAITARELVYGYYNDHTLAAAEIRAPVVIGDEHDIDATVKADVYLDSDRYQQGRGKGVRARLAALFVPDVLDDDGGLDTEEVFDRLRRGKPVRR
jgi:hypothetical protein